MDIENFSSNTNTRQIVVSVLKEHPDNNKYFDDMKGDMWKDFLDSIKTSGIISPIIITQDNIVISGNQRLRAAKELGLKTVPSERREYVDKDGVTKEQWMLKDLIETNIRQRGIGNLNSLKMAACINTLKEIYDIKNNKNQHSTSQKTQEELAHSMNMSLDRFKKLSKLENLIPEYKELIDKKILNESQGYQLAILDHTTQIRLYEVLGESIADKKTTELMKLKNELKSKEQEIKEKEDKLKAEEALKNKKLQDAEQKIKEYTSQLQTIGSTLAEYQNKMVNVQEDAENKVQNKLDILQKQHDADLKEIMRVKKEREKLVEEINDIIKNKERIVNYETAIINTCTSIEKTIGSEFTHLKGLYDSVSGIVSIPAETRFSGMLKAFRNMISDLEKYYGYVNEQSNDVNNISVTNNTFDDDEEMQKRFEHIPSDTIPIEASSFNDDEVYNHNDAVVIRD